MNAFQSRYAQYYDLMYADKPYAAEVSFLERVLRLQPKAGSTTWLDVACGSGNHALELSRRGYTVTGLDYSEPQLALASTKREQMPTTERARLTFVQGDMCTFDLQAQRFDVVSCLFDSLGYAVTNERVVAALRRMRHHLNPHGQVVLEIWHAAAMLTAYEPKRVRRIPSPEGELVRTSETTLDVANQTCEVKFTLSLPHEGGWVDLTEIHVCRFFLLQELSALLAQAGLVLQRAYAGFDGDQPIGADTWHIVVVASSDETSQSAPTR